MSQADKLLETLSGDEGTTYAAGSVTERHIVINTDRFITIPEELKRIGVETDHNVETVTFDCPRYWDDHDLSTMVIYINYMCANGAVGSYPATNRRIDADDSTVIHFDWIITNNVTQTAGKIAFAVCAKRTDDEGILEHYWHSELNTDMYVSEGLEVVNTIIEQNPDILTHVLQLADKFAVGGGSGGENEGGEGDPDISLSGGTMTSPIVMPKGDANTGIENGENEKIFGYGVDDNFHVGDAEYPLALHGIEQKPKYNGQPLAFASEIESLDRELKSTAEALDEKIDSEVEDIEQTIASLDKTGDILETMRTDLSDDWLLCNGEVLPREEYPALRKWLNNKTEWQSLDGMGMPLQSGYYLFQNSLINGTWFFLYNISYSAYLYDPNTNTMKVLNVPDEALAEYDYYRVLGLTHDGERYIMLVGYYSGGDTAVYTKTFIYTSVDAENWTEEFTFNREAGLQLRDAYYDGERILIGSYRTEYLNSKNYYYNKIYVLDIENKTMTALTDGSIYHTDGWFGFETCPPGYWRTKAGIYTEGTSSTSIAEGYCMYRSGETEPAFTFGGCGNRLVFFNDRFCLSIPGSTSTSSDTTSLAKSVIMDLQTGEQHVFPWSMIADTYKECLCYGVYYNEKTNMWRFLVYYEGDTRVFYNLHISADADPRDIMAWTCEQTTATSRESNYPRLQMGFDKSMIGMFGSSSQKPYSIYDSSRRFLPEHEGDTYKYVYAAGEVEEEEPDVPTYDDEPIVGYERLLAIESTGTQYVDTGFSPNGDTSVYMIAKIPTNTLSYNYLFGARNDTGIDYRCSYGKTGNTWSKNYNNGSQTISAKDVNTTRPCVFCFRKNKMYIDGAATGSVPATFEVGYSMYLSAVNYYGSARFGICTLYSCKIYNNDAIVRDFVPVRRISDGKLGLYDKQNKVFYPNAGTGEFVVYEMEETV